MSDHRIIIGDCRESMAKMEAGSVQCCVTSPPYWGLRDYGREGQLGLEKTPEEYVAKMVDVFRGVRRVLADDGVLWLNLGDSYAATSKGSGGTAKGTIANGAGQGTNAGSFYDSKFNMAECGLKPKDLVGIPWRVALALQSDGWYLRSDVIWSKPNPMPESVTDRPTKAHEYVFLLTKGPRYFYDADAVREPVTSRPQLRLTQQSEHRGGAANRCPYCNGTGDAHDPQTGDGPPCPECDGTGRPKVTTSRPRYRESQAHERGVLANPAGRNKRSVWTVTTQPFPGAHFAVMPPKLVEPCILAGSRVGDTILDPFSGAGTVGVVALQHGRRYIGCELNDEYAEMSEARIAKDAGQALMFTPSGGAV